MNRQKLGVGLVAALVIIGGSVFALSNRKDSTPLLGNLGATLARVEGKPLIPGPDVKFSVVTARVFPGPSPETGNVLRSTDNGPWWYERVTSNDPGSGNEYVTAATECTDSLVAGGATGATGTEMETVDPAPQSLATVWRNENGREWKKVVIPGVPPHSLITGLTSGRSFGKPELLVASARTITTDSDAFALFSADCGRTWSMKQLPLGTSKGFEYAAAVTASRAGFVMIGSADGPEKGRPQIMLWRSNDGSDWAATSKPETGFLGYAPQHVAPYFESIVVVNGAEDARASRRDSRIYEWTGERDSWFTAETFTRNAQESVGATSATGGVYVLQTDSETDAVYVVRVAGDAPASDKLPGVKSREYSTLQFFGSPGSEVAGDRKDFMWIVGQRKDNAKLETWSITLLDSATPLPDSTSTVP
jgi:hypothetical protein